MGRIAAGTPIEALQTRSHTISVPPDMLGSGEHYALEVRGDSMVDAGILDGDMALIQRNETADTGDIVVALIDDEEATLKRFRRRGASIALEPANTSYEVRILPPNRVKIQGKLIGLYPEVLSALASPLATHCPEAAGDASRRLLFARVRQIRNLSGLNRFVIERSAGGRTIAHKRADACELVSTLIEACASRSMTATDAKRLLGDHAQKRGAGGYLERGAIRCVTIVCMLWRRAPPRSERR